MIKQISTYGAAILTTMVVIRAVTMEKESDSDIRSLYERTTDQSYVTSNLDLRNSYVPSEYSNNKLIAANIRTVVENPFERKKGYSIKNSAEQIVSESIELADVVISQEELNSEAGLSLDRESTINSNLSTLFPRQRIAPKPSPY